MFAAFFNKNANKEVVEAFQNKGEEELKKAPMVAPSIIPTTIPPTNIPAKKKEKKSQKKKQKVEAPTPSPSSSSSQDALSSSLTSEDSTNHFVNARPKLSPETLSVLASMNFRNMTPVQQATLPLFLGHKDVAVEACTGSGKTLAFVVPIMELLLRYYKQHGAPLATTVLAMIIAPTRELARQIHDILSLFCAPHKNWLRVVPLLVGGTKLPQAKEGDDIDPLSGNVVVATPGRLQERMVKGGDAFDVRSLEVLVLDEADCLLDMGFEQTITSILLKLPKQRRTGLFSATQTKSVKKLVRAGLRNPVQISVKVNSNDTGSGNTGAENTQRTPTRLRNYFAYVPVNERLDLLLRFLEKRIINGSEKLIVFFATCASVEYFGSLIDKLLSVKKNNNSSNNKKNKHKKQTNQKVFLLHGKMPQRKREQVYGHYLSCNNHGSVLICTDVAARGIDIPDVDWIVQYDPPTDPDFYVHRVGRTARAGKSGSALLFLRSEENAYLDLLQMKSVPIEELSSTDINVFPPSVPLASSSFSSLISPAPITTSSSSNAASTSNVASRVRDMIFNDRDLLEKGTRAFVASVRAYKEHRCEYVFQFESLDLAEYATAFHLLRVPKMKELRDGKINGFIEEKQHIVEKIPFFNKAREKQRQIKLKQILEEKEEIMNARKLLRRAKPMNESEKSKQKLLNASKFGGKGIKRKKQSKGSKYWNEKNMIWDDVTEEERLAKRFKRGKITQVEFDRMTKELDQRSMNSSGREKATGAVSNKRRMVPKMMAKLVAEDEKMRRQHNKKDYGDEDEDAIENAKEVLRQHTARVVAAKRKHRYATKNLK